MCRNTGVDATEVVAHATVRTRRRLAHNEDEHGISSTGGDNLAAMDDAQWCGEPLR